MEIVTASQLIYENEHYIIVPMCFNCGCAMPDDDMGVGHAGVDPDGKSITIKTFEEAAKSMGQSKEEAMEETYKLLKKVLKKD